MGFPLRRLLPALIVGSVAAVAALPAGAMGSGKRLNSSPGNPTNPPSHREIVCHRTGSGYIVIPPAKASSHITNQPGEKERGHEGDFLLQDTYPDDDRKWPAIKASYQEECDSHVVTPTSPTTSDTCGTANDTYTIPAMEGVIYKVNGVVTAAGTYPGAGTITITAVADTEYMIKKGATKSWPFTFTNVTCATPATPTSVDACGTPNDTYTIPATEGVEYKVDGVVASAGSHSSGGAASITVTASALPGYEIQGTDSWTITWDTANCAVTATAPTVAPVCGPNNDMVTTPTIAHVTYDAGTWVNNQRTVTATADPGYTVTGGPWNLTDANVACPTEVTPSGPIVKVDSCGTANDTFEVPAQAGVVYKLNGTVVSGVVSTGGALSLTVTAEAASDYVLAQGAQTSFNLNFTNVACPTGTPGTPGTPGNPTGSVAGNQVTTPVTTAGVATLTVAKTGPKRARLGEDIIYTLRVRNSGNANASSVVLVDRIPTGMVVVNKPKGAKVVKATVTWNVGTLAPGRTTVVRVVMRGVGTQAVRRCNTAVASAANAGQVQAKACTNFSRVAGVTHVPGVAG